MGTLKKHIMKVTVGIVLVLASFTLAKPWSASHSAELQRQTREIAPDYEFDCSEDSCIGENSCDLDFFYGSVDECNMFNNFEDYYYDDWYSAYNEYYDYGPYEYEYEGIDCSSPDYVGQGKWFDT